MRRTVLLALLSISVLALVTTGCFAPSPGPGATPAPTAAKATAAPSVAPQATPGATPATALPQAIVVLEPKAQQALRSPARIAGHARVYEGTVRFELADATGNVLGKGFTTATAGAPEVGYFSAELAFTPPAQEEAGVLRVFSDDPRDGKRAGLVEVPVMLGAPVAAATAASSTRPAGTPAATAARTLALKVFFTRAGQNDAPLAEVTRNVPYTNQMGAAALQELVKGPTADEKRSGLDTAIPAGVGVKGLRIENGTAYADFDEKLQAGVSGSARITNIRKQITQTLLQFSTVQNVVISINGKTQDILKP